MMIMTFKGVILGGAKQDLTQSDGAACQKQEHPLRSYPGLNLRVQGLGFRVQDLRFKVEGFRGLGFRV